MKQVTTPTVTCVLSGILGNRGYSLKLADAIDRNLAAECKRYWFEDATYRRYPASGLRRLSSEFEAAHVARCLAAEIDEPADIFVINSHALAAGLIFPLSRRWPAARFVVALDATPAAIDRTSGGTTRGARDLVRRVWRARQHAVFKRLSRRVAAWLPICQWVQESLVADYGVAPGHCHVTRIPQAARYTAQRSGVHLPLRLLFVGNDFSRKGGELLVNEVKRQGAAAIVLTIVSNDPAALAARSVPGVTVVQGVRSADEVAKYYAAADLLALPTRMDCFPNVLCEGLAHGLPFVATDINGISELIAASGAGVPIAWPVSEAAVAMALSSATCDSREYAARSVAAQEFASRHLTEAAFSAAIASALSNAMEGLDVR